jgi:hypothetical protein
MFAIRLRLNLSGPVERRPVPKAWLDDYFMRNFLGPEAFDETLSVGDGLLEASRSVKLEEIRERFEKWLRGRRMIPAGTKLLVEMDER